MGLFRKSEIERLAELLSKAKRLEFKVLQQPINIRLESQIAEAEKVDYEALDLLLELLNYGKIDKQAGLQAFRELERIKKELENLKNRQQIGGREILETILKTLEYVIGTEKKYLYIEPGLDAGGYVRLGEVLARKHISLNGGVLEIRGSKLFYNSRLIGGATLRGDRIFLRAEHYSTKNALAAISSRATIEVSPEDPYSYLVESGGLARKTQEEIKHALGIKKNIQGRITFIVLPPISRTWIKCNPGKPCRFAVEGDVEIKAVKRGERIIVELL